MRFNLVNGTGHHIADNGDQICGCCGANGVYNIGLFRASNIGYVVFYSKTKETFLPTEEYYVDETILPDGTYLYVKINTQDEVDKDD